MIGEVTPKLSLTPQITNSILFSRVVAGSCFELDGFMQIQHFTKHLKFVGVRDHRITWTSMLRTDPGYVARDMGAGYFSDFTHEFDFRITASVQYATEGMWGVANSEDESYDIYVANGEMIRIRWINTDTLQLGFRDGVDSGADNLTGLSRNVTYYVTVERSGADVTAKVYSDADRTALVGTLSVTLTVPARTYRYIYGFCGYHTGSGAYAMSGYIENLTLNGDLQDFVVDYTESDPLGKITIGVIEDIVMKANDGTNDNEQDTLTTVTEQGGVTCFLPTTLLFSQLYHTVTPNDFMVCTSYVNEIAKIVSLDQSLLRLIFTFSSAPTVDGSKYTLAGMAVNVVAGSPSLIGTELTVSPDGNDNICVTVSVGDYTETFNGEAFGFNNLVAGKYMPKVTALTGSDTHIVLKLRWLKADLTTYVNSWVVLQNVGETPVSGSFYLTLDQYRFHSGLLTVGAEAYSKTNVITCRTVTQAALRGGKTLVNNAMSLNLGAWDRTQDYTMDSVGETQAVTAIPLQAWLLWYRNEIFLAYHGESKLSDNTTLSDVYTHVHGTMDKRVVETTLCRKRKITAVVYQSNGLTCSWTVCGSRQGYSNFNDPARLNTAGVWADKALGPVWTRSTGDYRGVGIENTTDGFAECMAFINYKSNLTFNFEECERVNVEFNIEPDLPNTLYAEDYIDHTHIAVNGTDAEYGATLEALLGLIGVPTQYEYDHGALKLADVLAGTYYATPLRYILAYEAGYHIVDLGRVGAGFPWWLILLRG